MTPPHWKSLLWQLQVLQPAVQPTQLSDCSQQVKLRRTKTGNVQNKTRSRDGRAGRPRRQTIPHRKTLPQKSFPQQLPLSQPEVYIQSLARSVNAEVRSWTRVNIDRAAITLNCETREHKPLLLLGWPPRWLSRECPPHRLRTPPRCWCRPARRCKGKPVLHSTADMKAETLYKALVERIPSWVQLSWFLL